MKSIDFESYFLRERLKIPDVVFNVGFNDNESFKIAVRIFLISENFFQNEYQNFEEIKKRIFKKLILDKYEQKITFSSVEYKFALNYIGEILNSIIKTREYAKKHEEEMGGICEDDD